MRPLLILALGLACDAVPAQDVSPPSGEMRKPADTKEGPVVEVGGAGEEEGSSSSGTSETTGSASSVPSSGDGGKAALPNPEAGPTMKKRKKKPRDYPPMQVQQRAIEHDLVSVDKKLDDVLKDLEGKM